MTINAIQYIETARTEEEANGMLAWLRTQDGFLGGRILMPTKLSGAHVDHHDTPFFTVQTFFDDPPYTGCGWLPDGCRRVALFGSMLKTMGVTR